MNCHTPGAQVVYSQHTANDVSALVIKHQHLPYRVTVLVQNRRGLRHQAGLLAVAGGLHFMVEIEDLLDGGCDVSQSVSQSTSTAVHSLPTCRSRSDDAMVKKARSRSQFTDLWQALQSASHDTRGSIASRRTRK